MSAVVVFETCSFVRRASSVSLTFVLSVATIVKRCPIQNIDQFAS